jgi:hypothetical protein
MIPKLRRALFWALFVPLGLLLVVLGLFSIPMQVYRGCLYVFMEVLERFENWCFLGPFGARQDGSLWETFKEGFEV